MKERRTRQSLTPDITPLIDVVFLLLIFFMVSTVFKKDELALLLNLPKASKGEGIESKGKNYIIEVSKQALAFNGKKVDMAGLNPYLQKIEKKSLAIELRIDKEVQYDRIVKILDKLKQFNLNNLNLVTNQ